MKRRPRSAAIGNALDIRADLRRNLDVAHGAEVVDAWLSTIPAVLESWCGRWEMTISNDRPNSGHSVLLFGESALAGSVVLKLNLPSPEVHSELEALAQTSGSGIVRLIDADPDVAIMMLERIRPGTPLRDANRSDLASTIIGAETMRRFWRTPVRRDHLFSLREWMSSLLEYPNRPTYPDGTIPAPMIDRAIETAECLLRIQTDLVLLHGDVHHDNVVRDGDHGWTTIDPKGLVGERGFDIGTWMHNPPGLGLRPDVGALLRARIATFSDALELDAYRIAQWSFISLVLSMCWTTETEGNGELASTMSCAIEMERIMDGLRP